MRQLRPSRDTRRKRRSVAVVEPGRLQYGLWITTFYFESVSRILRVIVGMGFSAFEHYANNAKNWK
jgi:hypothetical protein